jgi:phage baseplate assembly protein W
MRGTDASNGAALSGIAHLRQSVSDILRTPLGSRVLRRDYGSRLMELVDAPLNAETIAEIVAATAEALDRWEPRLRVERVRVSEISEGGRVSVEIKGKYLPDGVEVTLEGINL